MSDVSQGPGWWQASDGKWYPPEQAPGAQPPAGQIPQQPQMPMPGSAPAQSYNPTPGFGAPMSAAGAIGPNGQPLAEWPVRALSGLIDFIAPGLIAGVVAQVSFVLGSLMSVLALGWAIYMAYLNGSTGQSIGKKVAGTRVVNAQTGQLIGGGMGIVRYIAHFVDAIICYIGFLFPLWDAKKQTISDKIVGTVVETGAPKHEVNADLFKS